MIKAMKVEGADLFYPGRFYVLMALRNLRTQLVLTMMLMPENE